MIIAFECLSILLEKPNKDCLYNSYKDGDVCKGKLYFIERFQWTTLCEKKFIHTIIFGTSFTIFF